MAVDVATVVKLALAREHEGTPALGGLGGEEIAWRLHHMEPTAADAPAHMDYPSQNSA